ncbi:MAG: hypothetical protein UZ18_ATM001000451, partial [Armatimonadetes bacterium OLB18]
LGTGVAQTHKKPLHRSAWLTPPSKHETILPGSRDFGLCFRRRIEGFEAAVGEKHENQTPKHDPVGDKNPRAVLLQESKEEGDRGIPADEGGERGHERRRQEFRVAGEKQVPVLCQVEERREHDRRHRQQERESGAVGRSSPAKRPPVIVVPLRLAPGISASACQKPTHNPSRSRTPSSERSLRPTISATIMRSPRAIRAMAITYSERSDPSMESLKSSPKIAMGMVPTTIAHPIRHSSDERRWGSRIPASHPRKNLQRSPQKYTITATMVPNWMTAVKAAPGSGQPTSEGTIRMWAVLEIGKNSVSPCTMPSTIASTNPMDSPAHTRCPKTAVPRYGFAGTRGRLHKGFASLPSWPAIRGRRGVHGSL